MIPFLNGFSFLVLFYSWLFFAWMGSFVHCEVEEAGGDGDGV